MVMPVNLGYVKYDKNMNGVPKMFPQNSSDAWMVYIRKNQQEQGHEYVR